MFAEDAVLRLLAQRGNLRLEVTVLGWLEAGTLVTAVLLGAAWPYWILPPSGSPAAPVVTV